MRSMFVAFLIIALFLNGSTIYAQEDVCNILAGAIHDTRSTTTQTERALSFRNNFCDRQFTNSGAAKSYAASFGIELVSLGFSGNERQWSSFQKEYCSSSAYDEKYKQKTEEHISQTNPIAVASVNACLGQRGLKTYLRRTGDPALFSIHANWMPIQEGSRNPKVTRTPAFKNIECEWKPTKGDTVPISGWDITCRRTTKEAVLLTIQTDTYNLNRTMYLPPIPEPTPAPPPVVVRDKWKHYVAEGGMTSANVKGAEDWLAKECKADAFDDIQGFVSQPWAGQGNYTHNVWIYCRQGEGKAGDLKLSTAYFNNNAGALLFFKENSRRGFALLGLVHNRPENQSYIVTVVPK